MSRLANRLLLLPTAVFCLGANGCPPTGIPIPLLNTVFTKIDCHPDDTFTDIDIYKCWQEQGDLDAFGIESAGGVFNPTAIGKLITITITGSSPTMRIAARVTEGVSEPAREDDPTSPITTLTFTSTNVNVHWVWLEQGYPRSHPEFGAYADSGIADGTGAGPGDTITISVVQEP